MLVSQPPNKLLLRRIDRFTRMLHGVAEGDVRAVHRARVATRRLRELLPVVPVSGDAPSRLSRRLREVTRHLGPMRELDVSALVIREFRDGHGEHLAALDVLAESVERDRAATRRSVSSKRAVVERTRLARRLRELADQMARSGATDAVLSSRRWGWAVQARVVGRAERLKRAVAAAGPIYLPERLHDVRIAMKKLRYSLELLVDAGADVSADLETLKDKQNVLGRMHDLQMLMARARRLQASRDVGRAKGPELASLVDTIEDECRRLHARYVGDLPAIEALATRLGARRLAAPSRQARGLRRASG
jgi:CHAD domain-containing protein